MHETIAIDLGVTIRRTCAAAAAIRVLRHGHSADAFSCPEADEDRYVETGWQNKSVS